MLAKWSAVLCVVLVTLISTASAQERSLDDIDAFMEKVLLKRSVNWDNFYDYSCRELEEFSIEGSLQTAAIQGFRKEYLWFVRDGYFLRSPLSVDGVAVSDGARARAEKKWVERLEKRESERGPDRETFFGIDFEPGNYFYAGTTQFEGREVMIVEYYPERGPWSDDDLDEDDDKDEDDEDEDLEAQISKVLLITMLIDREEHQIVNMTLDNVGFDFLPGRWLFQLDTVEASLTMHQPIGDIWLARDISGFGRITTAGGDLAIRYKTTFYDYTRAKTSTTFRFPPRGAAGGKKNKQKK